MAGLCAVFGGLRRRGASGLLARVTSPSSCAVFRNKYASDASAFVNVPKAQERARMKAAALAAQSLSEQGQMFVFDRGLKAAQRDRAAWLRLRDPSGDVTDPFLTEIVNRTLDRLKDVKREFPKVLVLGGATDAVVRQLLTDRPDVTEIVIVDASFDMLRFVKQNAANEFGKGEETTDARGDDGANSHRKSEDISSLSSHTVLNKNGTPVTVHYVHADEEDLPLRDGSVDVVISALGLHWANDLPGAMSQARQALVPDGLFLSSVLGGETLRELRIACAVAEMEREGGVSQRVSPLAQVRDCGNLLTRAGMKLPAVDVDTLTMQYPNPMKLVEHLRSMGETNATVSRRPGPVRRTTSAAAAASYTHMFPADNKLQPDAIECTFQVLYMTGWSPGGNQPEPLERGSADFSLSNLEEEIAKVPGNK